MKKIKKFFRNYHLQIKVFTALFTIMFLQSTLLNHFRIFNVKPDLMLVSMVIVSFFLDLKGALGFAFLNGIFRDLLGVSPHGFNTIMFMLWVILIRRISKNLTVENSLIRSGILCLVILLNNLAGQLMRFVLDKPVESSIFLNIIIIETLSTVLIALPIYKLFTRIFGAEIVRNVSLVRK
ncbi:rod shape-determining protein MreD [Candidatus Omnitrophota bacterium]